MKFIPAITALSLIAGLAAAGDWPQFRGPDGSGVAEEKNLPVVDVADSDLVKVGQLVCAIGTPYKFEYTFTTGVVSAKGRNELLADKYED